MTKDPGKDFAPDDFVRHPADMPTREPATPGKATRTDGYTGNDAYDKEPLCEREPGLGGCSLLDRPRGELIGAIGRYSVTIATNQKLAVMKCERDILAEKPKDLEIFPALMLGAVGVVFGNVLTPLVKIAMDAAGTDLQVFTVAALTRLPLAFYQKQTDNAWKALPDVDSSVEARMKMLLHVESTVDTSMDGLFNHAKQALDDEQLKVLAEAMKPERHTPTMYHDALTAMLNRFIKSGVPQIGRGMGPMRSNPGHRDDSRALEDTRVIWVRIDGEPVLFYQHVDAQLDGDPRSRAGAKGKFGEMNYGGRLDKPMIGKPVPIEFYQAAVGAHIAKWGPVVPTTLDPAVINAAQRQRDRADIARSADKDARP
jgi:hypothetical protein